MVYNYITRMIYKTKEKGQVYKNQKPRVKCTIWYNNHETQLKMGSKHQALLANEQRLLDPKVRWRYRQRCQSLIILEWPLLVLQIFQITIVHVVLCYWCGKSSDTLISMYSIGVTTTTTTDMSPDRLDKVSIKYFNAKNRVRQKLWRPSEVDVFLQSESTPFNTC